MTILCILYHAFAHLSTTVSQLSHDTCEIAACYPLHFLRQYAIDRATPTKTSGAKVQFFEKEQFAAILDAADKESLKRKTIHQKKRRTRTGSGFIQ